MGKLLNWLKDEESGQGMVEYGLIIALVAVVLIGTLAALSGKLDTLFTDLEFAPPVEEG
jgi:Flp pilus assembly protein, pilin Flp